MKSVLPLRLASILAFVSFMAHTYLFQLYDPLKGKDELPGLGAIQGDFFTLDGNELHHYTDLYVGYGMLVVIATLVESALLWQLAEVEQATQVSMRSVILVFLFAEGTYAWLMWRDAFQYPMVLHGTMTLLLALAVVRGGPMAGSRAMLA